jgi:hypothetical protein
MGTSPETRWVLTYDKPDLNGFPETQTAEFNLATELPTLPSIANIEENAKQLNEAQEQQEKLVEERREAAEIERLGSFRPNAGHRPGVHADSDVIAVIKDGLTQ